jgi:four helix bundle protein
MPIRSYRDLRVWQGAMNLVDEIYTLTELFPKEERYALAQQLQRAAVSVPSNIAEGFGRSSTKDYRRFLAIARGSVYEIETQLEIARRRDYISSAEVVAATERATSVIKQINALRKSLDGRGGVSRLPDADELDQEDLNDDGD